MNRPPILIITQDDSEGSVMSFRYVCIPDEQAIEHFVSELAHSFVREALPYFKQQLIEMAAAQQDVGLLRRNDPSVQGFLTVRRMSAFTPETLPTARKEPAVKRRYVVPVVETRQYSRSYFVEACSPEEAHELAEAGETTHETEGTLTEISERSVTAAPKLAEDERPKER